MRNNRIRVCVASFGLALGGVAATATPAAARAEHDPSSGSTHNLVETFADEVPCAGDYLITTTTNATQHVVGNKNGFWVTFTETGTFDATQAVTITARNDDGDATEWEPREGPTYSGHFTVWGNFNLNRAGQPQESQNSTFTFSGHGVGSDGSIVRWSSVEHFSASAGEITRAAFSKSSCH